MLSSMFSLSVESGYRNQTFFFILSALLLYVGRLCSLLRTEHDLSSRREWIGVDVSGTYRGKIYFWLHNNNRELVPLRQPRFLYTYAESIRNRWARSCPMPKRASTHIRSLLAHIFAHYC